MSIENSFIKSLGLNLHKGQCPPLLLSYNDNQNIGPPSLAHLDPREYFVHSYVTKEQFDSYFKFAVVRDPYERIISIYKHFQYHRIISFPDFIRYEFPNLKEELFYFIKPQSDYLFDENDDLLVNYIGRFESFATVLNEVQGKVEFPLNELEHINKSAKPYNIYSRWNLRFVTKTLKARRYLIPYVNLRRKYNYSFKEFFDQSSLEFVNTFYERDFDLLSYNKIERI